MAKRCLNCGNISTNTSIRFCPICGYEFPQISTKEILEETRDVLVKSDKETSKFNKVILFTTISSIVFTVISLFFNISGGIPAKIAPQIYDVIIIYVIIIFVGILLIIKYG